MEENCILVSRGGQKPPKDSGPEQDKERETTEVVSLPDCSEKERQREIRTSLPYHLPPVQPPLCSRRTKSSGRSPNLPLSLS
jgi:hypothetical protein